MNKTTLVASVRMGPFNFQAQISLFRTALNFSVVCQWQEGSLSQGALLSVACERFCQQTKKPFNHRCGLRGELQQRGS